MRALIVAALGFLMVGAAVRAQQEAVFRGGTSIVPILATVLDADGRLVPDLERTDFTVLDNGKVQEIVFFQNDVQPFTVVVTMDFSFSMNNNLKLLKAAAEQFILRLLPDDKAQVGAFSDKINFSGTFTNDRDDLIAALGDLQYGNPTRLYDAIDMSIDLLLQSEFFTGQRIQRSRPSGALRRLADETGGGYFELKKTAELAPTFTRVAQELHSLYALGFTPTNLDNKEHRLEVRVKSGMTSRARRSYIASRDRLSGTN
jgi:hypothetical protein